MKGVMSKPISMLKPKVTAEVSSNVSLDCPVRGRRHRAMVVAGYLFPALLSVFIVACVLDREYVISMSWEFTEYGSTARNINRGAGPVSGSLMPYDIALLAKAGRELKLPASNHNRTLLTVGLTAASVWMFGATDLAVMLPNLAAFVVLVLAVHALQRRLLPAFYTPLAAVLVACAPVVFHSALQCYPNVIFAAILLPLLWLVYEVTTRETLVADYAALAALSGLAQLARSEFVFWLLAIAVYLIVQTGWRKAARLIAAIMAGWLALNSVEWIYAQRQFGTPARSETFWTNLANVEYGVTWLRFTVVDRAELVREHAGTFVRFAVKNTPKLMGAIAVEPFDFLGRRLRMVPLVLVALGAGALAWRGIRAGQWVGIALLCLMAAFFIEMFAVLRPGVRYFIWMLPWIGIMCLAGLDLVLQIAPPKRRASAADFAALLLVVAVTLGMPVKAWAGNTRHYVNSPTAYYTAGLDNAAMRQIMQQSLTVNFPAIRRTVPAAAVIMTDDPALHWYADRLVVYLPLKRSDFEEMERAGLHVEYIYLNPTMWFDEPQWLSDRYRHYLTQNGRLPDSFDAKLAQFLRRFPEFQPGRKFDNGGVLLVRRQATSGLRATP